MGKEFFNGWELWQKMTFCLACGIVLTVFIGLIKVQYDKYRIRKYSKMDKGKKTQTPEMLESQPVSSIDEKEIVPFGIRAIESGIEVDGVWISRSNTPVTSSRSSITETRLPRSHNSSQPDLAQPQPTHCATCGSSRVTSSFDRAVSAERIPNGDSRSSSPGRANLYDPRGRMSVAGPIKYSNPNSTRNSTTLQNLEGLPAPYPAYPIGRNGITDEVLSSSNSGKTSSRRTSDESDYMALQQDGRPYEAVYINPTRASVALPSNPRTDLDLLQTHRLSHVAETGQLTPRVRKPGTSGDWASVADKLVSPQETATINGVNYFVPQKTPSPPLATAGPSEEAPAPSDPYPMQEDSDKDSPPKQAVPLSETYVPRAPYYPDTYQPRGPQHQFSFEEVPYEVQTSQNQTRDDQVLRKVNSGFEILRPGTFAPPTFEELQAANVDKRQSKRLQKKRRSSSVSRSSHFVEQV